MKKISLIILCIMFMITSCEPSNVAKIQEKDQAITADTFTRLTAAVPAPIMNDSLERRQLVKRLQRFNVQDKISYIYLINFGKIMAYYVIKGKVSSVNSKLTCTQQVLGHYESKVAVESPALDGSYGSNGDAIFFFTTADIYVEWNGKYMLCDKSLKLSEKPVMVLNVK